MQDEIVLDFIIKSNEEGHKNLNSCLEKKRRKNRKNMTKRKPQVIESNEVYPSGQKDVDTTLKRRQTSVETAL